jgi:pimeloyl-ACP methyl ester carboxylesterase
MAKPQIVLVPGAWHTIAYFSTLIAKLQELGYTVHARQLASVGNPNPPKDLSQDVAIVNGTVEEAIGDGNDVVVICHSWGGLITGCSLAGLSKKEREAAGKKGGVVRAGYIAAFIAPEGVSLVECIPGGKPEPWWIIDVRLPFALSLHHHTFP